MEFELMKKGLLGGRKIPPYSISVKSSRFLFGDDLINYLGKDSFVQIVIDRKNNLVGFKKAKEGEHSYRMSKGCMINSKHLANKIPSGNYIAKIDKEKGLIILKVPEIAGKIDTIKIKKNRKNEK